MLGSGLGMPPEFIEFIETPKLLSTWVKSFIKVTIIIVNTMKQDSFNKAYRSCCGRMLPSPATEIKLKITFIKPSALHEVKLF